MPNLCLRCARAVECKPHSAHSQCIGYIKTNAFESLVADIINKVSETYEIPVEELNRLLDK